MGKKRRWKLRRWENEKVRRWEDEKMGEEFGSRKVEN